MCDVTRDVQRCTVERETCKQHAATWNVPNVTLLVLGDTLAQGPEPQEEDSVRWKLRRKIALGKCSGER